MASTATPAYLPPLELQVVRKLEKQQWLLRIQLRERA